MKTYSVRDKNGKNLGTFDIPTLSSMISEGRLNGEEEFQNIDRKWAPLSTLSELEGSFKSSTVAAAAPAAVPDDLASLFSDIEEPSAPKAQPAAASPPPTPKKPAAAPPPIEGSLDDLWADDTGEMVKGGSADKTMMGGPPPGISNPLESTMMGAPAAVSKTEAKPAAPAPNIALDIGLDFAGVKPPAAIEPNTTKKPKDDLEELFAAPDSSKAPPPMVATTSGSGLDLDSNRPSGVAKKSDDDLDGLVFPINTQKPATKSGSATYVMGRNSKPKAEEPPKAPLKTIPGSKDDLSVDALLSASPDAFAQDFSMPQKGNAPSASPPASSSKEIKSAQKSTSPSGSRMGDFFSQIKEKSLTIIVLNIVVLLGFVGFFGYMKFFAKSKPKTATVISKGGKTTTISNQVELAEKIKTLMGRDNYGSYFEVVDIIKNIANADPELFDAQLEALAKSQLRGTHNPDVLKAIEDLLPTVAGREPMTAAGIKGLTSYLLVKNDATKAYEKTVEGMQKFPNDSGMVSLLGQTYLMANDLGNAETYLSQAVDKNPADIIAHFGLYQLAIKKQNLIAAEERLKKILEVSPSHIASRLQLGEILLGRNDLSEAEKNIALITGAQSKDASPQELGDAFYFTGQIFEKQGKSSEAGLQYEQAAKANGKNPKILSAYGSSLIDQGRLDLAIETLNAARTLDPSPTTVVLLGTAYLKQKKFGDASLYFQTALRTQPEHVLGNLRLGQTFKEMGDLEKAISHLRLAQKGDEKNPEATLALAEIFAKLEKNDLAITEYKHAVSQLPKNTEVHLALADLYLKKKNLEAAGQELDLAAQFSVDPKERAPIYFKTGQVLMQAKKYKDAIVPLKNAIKSQAQFLDAQVALGTAYLKSGSPSEARDTLEAVRDLDPKGETLADTTLWLGNAYTENDEFAKAKEQFAKLRELKPDFKKIHFYLGLLYLKENGYQKAVLELESIINDITDPDERLQGLIALGKASVGMGDFSKAEKTYLAAVKSFPQNSEICFSLAQLYEEKQNIPKSIFYYDRVTALNPTDDRPHYHLGYVYKDLNKSKEALGHFRKALSLNPASKNADAIREQIGLLSGR